MSASDIFCQEKENVFFSRRDYSEIEFERCKDNNITFKLNKDNKNVYAHSRYNPIKEAEKFAGEIEFGKNTSFIIFGFGLGYFVRELLKRSSKRNRFFIYEPNNAVFSKVVDEGFCADIFNNKNVYVCSDDDMESFGIFMGKFADLKVFENFVPVISHAYGQVYEKESSLFIEIIKKQYSESIMVKNTSCLGWEEWTKNYFDNTENILNSYSVYQIKNIFEGKTAVVVSAGPSLSKNMCLLKEIKGKAPIISVFVAAKVLIENGIIPDFIVSIDSAQFGMGEMYEGIPLIYEPKISREFIDAHRGNKIFLVGNGQDYAAALMMKYNKDICVTNIGGSVACTCTDIAKTMGCRNIILIGQDLAYTNYKCHVDGTEHTYKNADEVSYEKIEVPAIGGGTVLTDCVFMSYLKWFENYASINRNEIRLIDATEGGALIGNTGVLSFREAIDKYCDNSDVDRVISGVFEKGTIFSEEEKKAVFLELEREFSQLDDILMVIEEEKNVFDRYVKTLRFSSDFKGILKIERQIGEYERKIEALTRKIPLMNALAVYIKNFVKYSAERVCDDNDAVESALIEKDKLLALEEEINILVKTLKISGMMK